MWSLYETKNGVDKRLDPLVFSNKKTQEDVVKEAVEAIRSGEKVIFIKGMCGTGKSAIALHIALELGRASIVVPVKNLQKQYQRDYLEEKYILKNEKDKDGNFLRLKIGVITGRQNHLCQYMKDRDKPKAHFENPLLQFDKKGRLQTNTRLDIFDQPSVKTEKEEMEVHADHFSLPCKIELKEKNREMLKEYLQENPLVKKDDFGQVSDLRRVSVAGACPYWSPILPSHIDFKTLADAKKESYRGLNDVEYTIYKRKQGCFYYEQFLQYKHADVIIFNAQKYLIENALNRKPATDVEIIDECDEFLDSFSNQESINLHRFFSALNALNAKQARALDEEKAKITREMGKLLFGLLDPALQESYFFRMQETKMAEILELMLEHREMFDGLDEEEHTYLSHCYEVALVFEEVMDQAFLSYKKEGNDIFARIVTVDLARRFQELLDKNKAMVLMSGTLHSEQVLRDVFGLKKMKIIEAETAGQGLLVKIKTGLEFDCKYENFRNGNYSREDYLAALSACIMLAKRPTLVHVNSFSDLPTRDEKEHYHLGNLPAQDELRQLQEMHKEDELVHAFKSGKNDLLFSTRCNRGIDFPGEQCNSIVITKYPYPDVKSLFWEILKKNKPEYYWEFYKDKARRELLQRVYRGLRSKNDQVQLLSPDSRVLNAEI